MKRKKFINSSAYKFFILSLLAITLFVAYVLKKPEIGLIMLISILALMIVASVTTFVIIRKNKKP